MGTFLTEGYLAAKTAERLGHLRTAAGRASRDMARDGNHRGLPQRRIPPSRSDLLGPDPASGHEHVSEVCGRGGIPCDPITEAVLGRRGPRSRPCNPEQGAINEKPS